MRGGTEHTLLARFWALLGGGAGEPAAVALEGSNLLPATAYDVNALATASIAAATLAVAEVQALRTGARARPVSVDRGHAGAAFRSERYLAAVGGQRADGWDPIAGDYETQDGWIRLHTNYRHHRAAALHVLGVPTTDAPETQDAVGRAVASWKGDALETAVVEAGGCAAFMRSPEDWQTHAQGETVSRAPLLTVTTRRARAPSLVSKAALAAPLAGIRVLDLTRVIAGPVCTRTLGAFGADVLRIDPPRFEEVEALLGDTTAGKRCAFLDLKSGCGALPVLEERLPRRRARARALATAPDALRGLGFDRDRLFAPQSEPRRGVSRRIRLEHVGRGHSAEASSSLVQMSCGIAWRGRDVAGTNRPSPLSAQALDHATGYLCAASACRGLARLLVRGGRSERATRSPRWPGRPHVLS